MRLLFSALVILLLGVMAALAARDDPGMLVIHIRDWMIETSVVFAVVVVLLLFVVLYVLLRMLATTFGVADKVRHWKGERRRSQAILNLNRGLLELLQGDWKRAQRYLLSHLDDAEAPAVNYLAAACAAQQQGDIDRRDSLLEQAHYHAPRHGAAVSLIQAELQIRQGQLEQALATLTMLHEKTPKNKYVLARLKSLYIQLQDWERLVDLLPLLRKRNVLDKDGVRKLEQQAFTGMLQNTIQAKDYDYVTRIWARMPKSLRQDNKLVLLYVRGLIMNDKHDAAERVLADALQQNWQASYIYLYGLLDKLDAARLLGRVEQWLKNRQHDPVLLLTAGRICQRASIWGKARDYLEESARELPQAETYHALAEVMEASGDQDKANAYYKSGLQLANDNPVKALGKISI